MQRRKTFPARIQRAVDHWPRGILFEEVIAFYRHLCFSRRRSKTWWEEKGGRI